jgi:hypothetical protein
MSVRPGAAARLAAEEEHGGTYVAVVSAHEAVRAPAKGKLVLSESKHEWRVTVKGVRARGFSDAWPYAGAPWPLPKSP